jgi:hypothetical protein
MKAYNSRFFGCKQRESEKDQGVSSFFTKASTEQKSRIFIGMLSVLMSL